MTFVICPFKIITKHCDHFNWHLLKIFTHFLSNSRHFSTSAAPLAYQQKLVKHIIIYCYLAIKQHSSAKKAKNRTKSEIFQLQREEIQNSNPTCDKNTKFWSYIQPGRIAPSFFAYPPFIVLGSFEQIHP